MARKCLALNTFVLIIVGLQKLLQMSQQNMNLSKRLDTVEGKSYKHFYHVLQWVWGLNGFKLIYLIAIVTCHVDRKSVVVGKECRSRWSPYH